MEFSAVAVEIADAAQYATAELAGWFAGDDIDGAAHRVAAEQRALRALEHFDPFDIEQRRAQPLTAAQEDTIDIDAHRGIAAGLVGIERHDAANPDGEGRGAREEGGDAQRRDAAVSEISQALHPAVFEIGSGGDRNGDRGFLQLGFAAFGGDDDFGEPGIRIGGCQRLGKAWRSKGKTGSRSSQNGAQHHD